MMELKWKTFAGALSSYFFGGEIFINLNLIKQKFFLFKLTFLVL